MKKVFKNPLFTFILGVLSTIGITSVLAYSLFASDIGFTPRDEEWNVSNTKEALDDLYLKINRPMTEIATGYHTFSSGSTSLFKMNMSVTNTDYLTNDNNVITVNIPGKYLITTVIGTNTSPNQACTYTGYLYLYVNDVQVQRAQSACSYVVKNYVADLLEGDKFYIALQGDGANYPKRGEAYIYRVN